jgi:hypothetical protein
VGEVVFCTTCSSNGSSYVALSTNTDIDPPTNSGVSGVWHLIAQVGATGAAGAAGGVGAAGATGAMGATGPAGGVTSVSAGTITTGGAASLSVTNGNSTPTINITVPSIYGDGSSAAGLCNISSSTNWVTSPPATEIQCGTFTLSAGTLTVPSGTVIRATGAVTIDGTIVVQPSGAQGLYVFPALGNSSSGGVALPSSAVVEASSSWRVEALR